MIHTVSRTSSAPVTSAPAKPDPPPGARLPPAAVAAPRPATPTWAPAARAAPAGPQRAEPVRPPRRAPAPPAATGNGCTPPGSAARPGGAPREDPWCPRPPPAPAPSRTAPGEPAPPSSQLRRLWGGGLGTFGLRWTKPSRCLFASRLGGLALALLDLHSCCPLTCGKPSLTCFVLFSALKVPSPLHRCPRHCSSTFSLSPSLD
ncbi:predicted GPI-anchored protein 58 isoform X2 [Heterocephalus glaber]|uniref:Predicted GPI-anchored protein 58 isoform X2 n=1 Tax=Heterocephalus glaber TaxID=10181 RepID=A0AAX6RLJ0_HETGA|nr:predicted GPI-anchored protein 58 isoform X2 [Heterocephalus glaber]